MLSKHNKPIRNKSEYRQFGMASIPNGRVYEEIVSNLVVILNGYEGIRKILIRNQIIVMNFNFIFFDNRLGNTQRF